METKRRSWRKILASFAVGGVILSGLAMGGTSLSGSSPIITDASAGVSGGGGGGGGGSTGGFSGAVWVEIPKSNIHPSRGLPNRTRTFPEDIWNGSICQNAQRIFGLIPQGAVNNGAPHTSWTYSLWGVGGLNASSAPGGSTVASAIASNTGNSYQWAVNYMYQKNFICLDNPNVITTSEWRYEVRSSGGGTDSLNEPGVYSRTTTVKPQFLQGATKDIIGADNLKEQPAVPVYTEYRKVFDQFKAAMAASGANKKNIVAQFKPLFEAARKKDAAAAAPTVTLTKNNQEGLGEGGILNISETQMNARATASTTTTNYRVWRCGYVHYSRSGWQPSSANNCGAVSGTINPNALPTAGLASARWLNATERGQYKPTTAGATSWKGYSSSYGVENPTQQQVGFWQIISAHCNLDGVVALKNAMAAKGEPLVSLDSADASGEISGLLRTKIYAQVPSPLPLGSTHSSLPDAQRATGTLGFFDKECPFDCTPDKTGSGASANNGAIDNVSNGGWNGTGLYGSKSADGKTSTNSNYSEMFRDNTDRTISPDVWYPLSKNGVSYGGEAPKSTLFTRWAQGTPALGTEFNAYAGAGDQKSKTPLFTAGSSAQKNQKNFDVAEGFSSSTAAQVPGLVDKLTVQSTWASSDGKPQALQVAWEYSPSVITKVPTSLGFQAGGTNVTIGSWVDQSTQIDGRCWGNFGTRVQTPAEKTMSKNNLKSNTGTGATTNFTAPNKEITNARNLVINFIRGTAE